MQDVDVVVIGSGPGGLTAAVALANAGKKVAVFEQHYLPGGWCHSFTLEGYRFSPGVHYIGELGPHGRMRKVCEGLGLGDDLEFYELNPDGLDHVHIRGKAPFDIPRGKQRLVERLQQRFPEEARGIQRYYDTIERISRELEDVLDATTALDLARFPFRAPTVVRWAASTARDLMTSCVRDPDLLDVLGAQAGNHGLPPSQASAPMHAAVMAHYFDGGFYPRGGAHALPRAFIRALRRQGGEIHVRTPVERILLEGGRAIGVRLADGTEVRAKHVISNADVHVTFGQLLPREALSRFWRWQLDRMQYSVSAISLFLATDLDVRARGMDSGNYWYYDRPDVDAVYRQGLTAWRPEESAEAHGLFLTCTTLKDPSKDYGGRHTLEAFAFVGYDAFNRWQGSETGARSVDYAANKARLLDLMLRGVDKVVPGLKDHVSFAELGTPLTNRFYCASTRGNLYGTAKARSMIGPFGFQVRSPVRGLSLVGACTLGHGVLGASLSGLVAARDILGARRCDDLLSPGPSLTLSQIADGPTRKKRLPTVPEAHA